MTEIRFYHLERATLERALPTMLERVLDRGQRALVVVGSKERLEALNAHLWTYRPDSFLPHGTAADGFAPDQPVLLATAGDPAAMGEPPNRAEVLFLADGARAGALEHFKLCAELFDGTDGEAVAAARRRWRDYKDAGHRLTYWRQTDQGWKEGTAE
ncbi:MAG: DNA polymerase III subunit chi [Rhodospirillales bacterium]